MAPLQISFQRNAAAAFAARFICLKGYNALSICDAGCRKFTNRRFYGIGIPPLANLQYLELQAEYTRSSERATCLLQEAIPFGVELSSLRYGLGQSCQSLCLGRM